jgi:hypothetical protein
MSPATIDLAATATDADGSIAKVEFFNGTTKIGEDLTAPYTYSWVGVAAGTYSLTATATDNLSSATTSAAVSVTVNDNMVAQGCGVGYWKNHTDRWSLYSPTTAYGSVFQNAPSDLKNKTLLQVLGLGGGGSYNLGRQSVAALLNISSSSITYYASDYSTVSSLQAAVNAAIVNKKTANALASNLENSNDADCPLGGSSTKTARKSSDSRSVGGAPEVNGLLAIYPNPSADNASIGFTLAKGQHYSVQVFDARGRVVARIASGRAEAGKHYSLELASRDMPAGVYMVQLTTDSATQMRRLIISK